MDRFQPLRDTIDSLAGSPIPRTPRPGEQFERPETDPPKHHWTLAPLLITGVRRLGNLHRANELPTILSEACPEQSMG